jgi:2-C-methyl-D-erythritol 2,4-cyclodiphosphate synthase
MRVGFGYDVHAFVTDRPLFLGGVEIPHTHGLLGHSDADVLSHAIIDAVIGALGIGDIGRLFPDTDPQWKDASSIALLRYVIDLMRANEYEISWIDSVIIAEKPKLSPFIEEMKNMISSSGVPPGSINIKVKTNEGMGFTGQGEGIAAYAVCLLKKIG